MKFWHYQNILVINKSEMSCNVKHIQQEEEM